MKTGFFFFICLITTTIMNAQSHSWKITDNKTVLLKSSEESKENNTITIDKKTLEKAGAVTITYTHTDEQPDWKRYLALFDEVDTELYKKQTNCLTLSHQQLLTWAKGAKTLHIYTWSLPTDPDLAARIRIRRIHLCTLIVN